MIDPIGIFSSTAYSAAAWQAKIDAARAAQREQALEDAQARLNQQNSQVSNARAAELSGSFAVQALNARTNDARQVVQPSDDALNGNQARNLRSSSLFSGTDLQDVADSLSPFRLAELQARRPQTIADLQSPAISLDSAAFVNIFANARPTLNLAVDNQPKAEVDSQHFQRATSTLARVYSGAEDVAIDFAA